MTLRVDLRIDGDRWTVGVPGGSHLGMRIGSRNVMVLEERSRGRVIHAIGAGFADMPAGDAARARGGVEVVPFGADHLEAAAAEAAIRYFLWVAWFEAHPGWHSGWRSLTRGPASLTMTYRDWPRIPAGQRDAFLDALGHNRGVDELVVNGRLLLRQTRARRLLGRPPSWSIRCERRGSTGRRCGIASRRNVAVVRDACIHAQGGRLRNMADPIPIGRVLAPFGASHLFMDALGRYWGRLTGPEMRLQLPRG